MSKPKKFLVAVAGALALILTMGALSPTGVVSTLTGTNLLSLITFNTDQFGVSGTNVTIKSGALLTNMSLKGYATFSGQTNQLSDDGSQLLYNGSPIVAGSTNLTDSGTNVLGAGGMSFGGQTNLLSDDGTQLTYNGASLSAALTLDRTVLTHAGTVSLDFAQETSLSKLVLTGNVELAFSNLATNHTYDLIIANSQATNCSYVIPTVVYMGYYPTNVVAQKYARWWFEVDCETNSIVYATYVEQQ